MFRYEPRTAAASQSRRVDYDPAVRIRVLLAALALLLAAVVSIATWTESHRDDDDVRGRDRASVEDDGDAREPLRRRAPTPEARGTDAATDTWCDLAVRLIDLAGSPVAGVTVRCRTRDAEPHSGVTDDAGRVVLHALPHGLVELRYDGASWNTDDDGDARRVRVPYPEELVLRVTAPIWVCGVVVDGDRRPVAGARVAFTLWDIRCVTTTDTRGAFALALPTDRDSRLATLLVWAPGFAPYVAAPPLAAPPGASERRDFVLERVGSATREWALTIERTFAEFDADAAERSRLPDDDECDDELRETLEISGRVVGADGAALPRALVRTRDHGSVDRTNANGAFTVTTDSGDVLVVEAEGHVTTEFALPEDGTDIGDLVVPLRIDARVRLLFDEDGTPASGAWVEMQGTSATTDTEGVAVLRGVDPRTFDLPDALSIRPGHSDAPQPVPTTAGPLRGDDVSTFRVARGCRVCGVVLDPEGRPLVGAWCSRDGTMGGSCAWTDLDGRFAVPGIARTGDATVSVHFDGYDHAHLVVPVGVGSDHLDVTLRFPARAVAHGVLRLPDEHAVGNVTLCAVPLPPFAEHVQPASHRRALRDDGAFSFPLVVGQRYRLLLDRGSTYARRLGEGDVVVGGATDIDLAAHRGTSILGTVQDTAGPLLGALIEIRNVDDELDTATVTSFRGGRFEFLCLDPGATYRLRGKHSERATEWQDLGRIAAGTQGVVVDLE